MYKEGETGAGKQLEGGNQGTNRGSIERTAAPAFWQEFTQPGAGKLLRLPCCEEVPACDASAGNQGRGGMRNSEGTEGDVQKQSRRAVHEQAMEKVSTMLHPTGVIT